MGLFNKKNYKVNDENMFYQFKRKKLKNSTLTFFEDRIEESYLGSVYYYSEIKDISCELKNNQVVLSFLYKGEVQLNGWIDKNDYNKLLEAISFVNQYIEKEKAIFDSLYPTAVEKLNQLKIDNPSLSLNSDEVCFYEGKANSYNVKNVVVGHKSGGAGASIRIAKGVSVHTGGGASQNIRGDVEEQFQGTLYITNMRIVLLAPKYGFDVQRTKVNKFEVKSDGFIIYVGAKSYCVITNDMDNIINVLNLINQGVEEQTQQSNRYEDPYEELKKVKELLDMGIITQKEFEAKKKQLLEL